MYKRQALVCENSLCQVALDHGLGRFLRLGKGLEQAGGRSRPAILEDMVESIFGAVYLDGGLEAAVSYTHLFCTRAIPSLR